MSRSARIRARCLPACVREVNRTLVVSLLPTGGNEGVLCYILRRRMKTTRSRLRRRIRRNRFGVRTLFAIALSLGANALLLWALLSAGAFAFRAPGPARPVSLAHLSQSEWDANRAVTGQPSPAPPRVAAPPPQENLPDRKGRRARPGRARRGRGAEGRPLPVGSRIGASRRRPSRGTLATRRTCSRSRRPGRRGARRPGRAGARSARPRRRRARPARRAPAPNVRARLGRPRRRSSRSRRARTVSSRSSRGRSASRARRRRSRAPRARAAPTGSRGRSGRISR